MSDKVSKLEEEYYALKKTYQDALDRVHKKYADQAASLKARLAVSGKCSHQSVREYSWQSGNGYGRQSWNKGLECQICGLRNSWPNMSALWHDPKNDRKDDDY